MISSGTETVSFATAPLQGHKVTLLLQHAERNFVEPLNPGIWVTVGRSEPSQIVIPSGRLSRSHARFRCSESGSDVTVEDLDSKNGTLLNGQPIVEGILRAGDSLTMGDVVASLHVFEPRAASQVEGMTHGRFVTLLEAEVIRTRELGTRAALALLWHPTQNPESYLPWLKPLLRPSDSLALYSNQHVEVLLSDTDSKRIVNWSAQLSSRGVRVGLALLPGMAADAHELLGGAQQALARSTRQQSIVYAASEQPPTEAESDLLVASELMSNLLETVERAARSDIPVLLEGETGTGKELIARRLHDASARSAGPLKTLNCGALNRNLLESTLFGHEKGAFTGAAQQKKGLFEQAEGGSIFLDEIGELPLEAQASLLRVVENKVVTRLGSSQELPVNVRLLAASHRNLELMTEQGQFRQDLWFRLNAVTLNVPPLRERPEDIPLLARFFLKRAAHSSKRSGLSLDSAALELLMAYQWPGNVRELRNEMDRAAVIGSTAEIGVHDLSDRLRSGASKKLRAPLPILETDPISNGPNKPTLKPNLTQALRPQMLAHEHELLVASLEACDWNQTLAAQYLDLPRRTLVHKLRQHGIRKPIPPAR